MTHSPAPEEKDVQFILDEVKRYLSPDVQGKILYFVYYYCTSTNAGKKFLVDEGSKTKFCLIVLVRRGDVLSSWSGIRPLVRDPEKEDTQSLVRNHVVHVSKPGGLVTIAGGKWTTYRSMAKDTLDRAVKENGLDAKRPSQTDGLLLEGGHTWTPTLFIRLVQDLGVDTDVSDPLLDYKGILNVMCLLLCTCSY